jgi:hypothetical protein
MTGIQNAEQQNTTKKCQRGASNRNNSSPNKKISGSSLTCNISNPPKNSQVSWRQLLVRATQTTASAAPGRRPDTPPRSLGRRLQPRVGRLRAGGPRHRRLTRANPGLVAGVTRARRDLSDRTAVGSVACADPVTRRAPGVTGSVV